jgi:DNA processing protein
VLAGGLDNLYPLGNAPLFEQLLRQNAIIAEVPPGVAPAKWRFLMRNRLIAALGQATIVVEAGKRSGSMSTASHALEIDRPIAVVPGRWTDSSSRGCLNLLRDNPGAVQVLTCATDALDLIGLAEPAFELRESMGVLETRALDAFGKRTLGIIDVQRIAGLTFAEAQLALGRLELDGYLERHINGYRKSRHNLET